MTEADMRNSGLLDDGYGRACELAYDPRSASSSELV
jgi:hypothetical protein